ncbi:hypothetical protein SLEP1_g27614 [Rubroshorea leprosula]|uniref:Uncharacterized protein n=1 Tax=Rubroshorea leprosula TaxID=152421 RepID=A0AAV5JWI7_9ROSI|nr:hypothetical protein SLEP1_g27614 [Rubroshorea leprosula]
MPLALPQIAAPALLVGFWYVKIGDNSGGFRMRFKH